MRKIRSSASRGGWMRRLSVRTQVILLLAALVLPVCVIAVSYIWVARNAYEQQSREGVCHAVEIYLNQTVDRMGSVDNYLTTSMAENVYVAQMYQKTEFGKGVLARNFFWQELNKRCRYLTDADAYFFMVAEGEYANVAIRSAYVGDRIAVREYLREHYANEMPATWFLAEIDGTKWLVHGVTTRDFSLGALINLTELEQEINAQFSGGEAQICLTEAGEAAAQAGGRISREFAVVTLKSTNIEAEIFFNRPVILGSLPAIHQMGLVFCVVCLVVIPILLLGLNRWMIVPMQRLNAGMRSLGEGNSEYRITEAGENREAGELNQRFNAMADQIMDLKIEAYEKELARMEIESINLRLQVNPHFLLNSLNIIFSMSKSGKLKEIKSFTKYLADYLRFSLWHTGGMVSLKSELKGVENYLEIQMVRFPGKFTYVFDVEEELEQVSLPSLLILNFVENSIKYALDMEREIEILVIVRRKEEMISISVCDTGNGMAPEVLDCLNRAEILDDERGKHIGVWNCRRRMELIYGKEAQIHITSSPGGGTQVYLLLPEKARDVQACEESGHDAGRGAAVGGGNG